MEQRGYIITCLLAAPLFYLSGWWSAVIWFIGSQKLGLFGIPIPFIVLVGVFVGRKWPFLLVAAALFVSWMASYAAAFLAVLLSQRLPGGVLNEGLPMCLAGAVGGAGVVLSCAIMYSHLRAAPFIYIASFLGFLAAIPFGFYFHLLRHSGSYHVRDTASEMAFAVWQMLIGTYLVRICLAKRSKNFVTAIL